MFLLKKVSFYVLVFKLLILKLVLEKLVLRICFVLTAKSSELYNQTGI